MTFSSPCPSLSAEERRRALLARHGYNVTPSQVFHRLVEGFEQAGVPQLFNARIGTLHTRFSIVGSTLAEALWAPFAHLRLDDARDQTPALTVEVWASPALSDDVPTAPHPWGLVVDDPEHRLFHDWRPESDMVLDVRAGRIVGRMEAPSRWQPDQWARPLHRLMAGVLSHAGIVMLHAALVGSGGDAVLLAGAGGSGKSTTALACLFAGLDLLGDDTIAVAIHDQEVIGYSLYATALANPFYLGQHGFDCERFAPQTLANEDKPLWRLPPAPPWNRIRAILLPCIGGTGRTVIEPARSGDFLRAAAAHSTFVNIQNRYQAMEVMAEMAKRLPVWRLTLASDPAEVVARVRDFIGTRGRNGADP
ncbi:conserved hypothetical protein [Gammaproteobacteria bacterium]